MPSIGVVIVGGGPQCTYALERLAALLPGVALGHPVVISVFERTGSFGAGAVYREDQPRTNYMNRITGQIALAADESNQHAVQLLPSALRPTFEQWCAARLHSTGDERFALGPRDVPRRYLHGMALREAFERYVGLLRTIAGVTVELYPFEVIDISESEVGPAPFLVHYRDGTPRAVAADHVLLVTGHGHHHAPRAPDPAVPPRHVQFAYPLETQLAEVVVPPGSTVGVRGLGLTAIDVFLHLTEGRGGHFEPAGGADVGPFSPLRYVRSGREPARIVAAGPSGLLPTCRPDNVKAADPARLEHRGVFFSVGAVRALREVVGVPALGSDGRTVRQLDFDRHLLPLLLVEMGFVYYTTLGGAVFAERARSVLAAPCREFLARGGLAEGATIDDLLAPLHRLFEEHAEDSTLRALRFDWRRMFAPLPPEAAASGATWSAALVQFMRQDVAAAATNNLRHPVKAACDGVWRDLRAVLSEAVDRGGLLPESHRRFMDVHLRHYHRLSNGSGPEAMNKTLALIECGLLDVSTGPEPSIEPVPVQGGQPPRFRIRGGQTGSSSEVDVLIEAHLPAFDPERDVHPLHPNLLRRGLVRKWRNPGVGPSGDFLPGGLDLTDRFHPLRRDGRVESRLTCLGAPADGVVFFQASAARPGSNNYILNQVGRWARDLIDALGAPAVRVERGEAGCAAPLPMEAFRARVRSVLEREAATARPRHVVVLGIDGIARDIAVRRWRRARIDTMRAVFPTTSSAGWLSSLTGLGVDAHGVPGVVFHVEDPERPDAGARSIHVFEHRGSLGVPEPPSLFSDATQLGYRALSIPGDLADLDCTWRELLLGRSSRVQGHRFFTGGGAQTAEAISGRVRVAIHDALSGAPPGAACFVWCFIDADLHIHKAGYDDALLSFLDRVEQIALDLLPGAIVLAHSDHGLTPTAHDPAIAELLARVVDVWHGAVGGAGRTRWIHPAPGSEVALRELLRAALPPSVTLHAADELFTPGSLSRRRVGEIVLVARGEAFVTSPGYRYDHGSLTERELLVPLAEWRAPE